jgi:predicted ATPase
MAMLTKLELSGFKSIKRLSLPLGRMNVLIGANGAGKSNFISFFRFLGKMMDGELQFHIAKNGGAYALLFDGAATTPEMAVTIMSDTKEGVDKYCVRLEYASGDTLVFAEERCARGDDPYQERRVGVSRSLTGHHEAVLPIHTGDPSVPSAKEMVRLLRRCAVHHFHNTSETARIRQRWDKEDNHSLKEDGANLAPFLLRLRDTAPKVYGRIVAGVRQIAPFFADFVLAPTNGSLLLQWRERHTDMVFGSHQASDGTLRAMALIALLLQPADELPDVIILDEPELGLHPAAVEIVAGLLKSAAVRRQVILATQSLALVDQFEPDDIIVVDRRDRESEFKRLNPNALRDWMEEYSLGELWEKNVLGGRPS